jgi:hypothetical protein
VEGTLFDVGQLIHSRRSRNLADNKAFTPQKQPYSVPGAGYTWNEFSPLGQMFSPEIRSWAGAGAIQIQELQQEGYPHLYQ